MKQEVSPKSAALIFGALALLVVAAALFVYGPFKPIPRAPKSKPASGGPGIPPPLPPEQIRHGPIGS
jgi:hypothetical protein